MEKGVKEGLLAAAALLVTGGLVGGAWAQQGAPAAPAPAADATPAASANGEDIALAERGAYLARAADCMSCHTGDPRKPYGGNRAFHTPSGTLFSVNITSDPTYGIGTWTFEDFRNALRNGIRADGAYLYPAMPFDAYAGMTEDDLKALWAFVRRIPPVAERRKENALSFPFNVRLGMTAWRELFFEPATFKPDPGRSDQWNRGAYLVTVLGHCADCHTPRNIMGAAEQKQHFLGTEGDGYWTSSVDAATLKEHGWTQDALVTFFTDGSAPGKRSMFGPMAEVVRDSLAYLTPADREALVTYLLDSPPPADIPAPQAASPLSAAAFTAGATLYVEHCAPCHGSRGAGSGDVIPPLAGNPAVNAAEPYNVIMAVLDGLPAGGGSGPMLAFADRLSDDEVATLANYVRSAWGHSAPANVSADMVAVWRATAKVPDYRSRPAAAFDCPQVDGAPDAPAPDAAAVAALTQMMQTGERQPHGLAEAYKAAVSAASPADTVAALAAGYCPVVAATALPDWQKAAELRRFALQGAAAVSPSVAAAPMPDVSLPWAAPVGASLVIRQPGAKAGPPACPRHARSVPQALRAAAATLMGNTIPPVTGDAAAQFATTLSQQNPRARRADVANALIAAYCPLVVGQADSGLAEQHARLDSFAQQVVQTLQIQASDPEAAP